MFFLLLGGLALIAFIVLARSFVKADPQILARNLRWLGGALLGLGALGLTLTGRFNIAIVLAPFALALLTGGRFWPGGWPSMGSRNWPGGSTKQVSRVSTEWLEMELHHDTGVMDGAVRKGAFAGASLGVLDRAQLTGLLQQLRADAESTRLLETYLDRRFGPGWRAEREAGQGGGKRGNGAARSTGMSRAEALRVLGLAEEADENAIRAAYHKLMLQNHPDRGGSDYLAAKINEAKDVLLG
ncbi:MAG: DnaJ domain-containing protein [Alphaproteobacteria bacterium]|nr:DnaJ domain-containing protein [Alphaproteobacteria bacterium]MBN9578630.1 DnaJ domain-containing protein [Alphaproteobacteria bacterium]MBN9590616.1 DnaJ domain-containing protein [Alphaproteobacteria bacterium]